VEGKHPVAEPLERREVLPLELLVGGEALGEARVLYADRRAALGAALSTRAAVRPLRSAVRGFLAAEQRYRDELDATLSDSVLRHAWEDRAALEARVGQLERALDSHRHQTARLEALLEASERLAAENEADRQAAHTEIDRLANVLEQAVSALDNPGRLDLADRIRQAARDAASARESR
jgi:chromosome segregation ATPase